MVDFFETVLSHVADPEIAGDGIERKAEWIAQAEEPNFRATAARANGLPVGSRIDVTLLCSRIELRDPDRQSIRNERGRAEIWLFGLRNPFRFSFDSVTGDLWIGDVGQNSFEEVDHLPSGQGAPILAGTLWKARTVFRRPRAVPPPGLRCPFLITTILRETIRSSVAYLSRHQNAKPRR